jgi:scytalone dehydratase
MGPGKSWPDMPAAEFVEMMSSPSQLGNPLIATQHLIGGSTWQRISETEIKGTHQLRAAHQRYQADPNGGRSREVVAKGHGHAKVVHFYKKEEDEKWKLTGLRPEVYFDEFSIAEVFGRKG